MVFFFLKQAKLPGHMVEKLKRFDWTGAVLFTVGSGSFLFGISSGGVMYEWDSWQVLLSILMGVAVLGGFALWEARFATGLGVELLVPAKLFDNWSIISSYIQAVLHGAILWSLIYFLSKFLPPPPSPFLLSFQPPCLSPMSLQEQIRLTQPIQSSTTKPSSFTPP